MAKAREKRSNFYDVLIAGGGMVGCALACALGQQGCAVGVLERRGPERNWPTDEVDLRVSALTRASQHILTNLGVWDRMVSLRVSPFREMHVWDANGSGSIHFDSAELGEPDLGHIVENRVTRLALWECIESLKTVDLICPVSVNGIDRGDDGVDILLDDGSCLQTSLLVAADGRDSMVRNMAGISTHGWSYDQHAVVTTITPEKPHNDTAWQRFMPSGPLAFLPLNDGRCSIVWSTTPRAAEQLLALEDNAFCAAVAASSEFCLGDILGCGPRGAFPLRLQHAANYVIPGLALVGDAAHAIHPLAGQGVNLGFLDAATLAEVLLDARAHNRAWGGLATLRRYERTRKANNLLMLAAMDGFKRLFGNDLPPLRLARNLALRLADEAVPLKNLIMRRAMGLNGELPELAKS